MIIIQAHLSFYDFICWPSLLCQFMSVFVTGKCFASSTVDVMMKRRFDIFNNSSLVSVDDWRKDDNWVDSSFPFLFDF